MNLYRETLAAKAGLGVFCLLLLGHLGVAQAKRARLTVKSWPLKARVEVKSADGKVVRGRAPFRTRLTPGPIEITVSKRKHRSWKRSVTLGASGLKLTACIDPVDQLVRCHRLIDGAKLRPKAVAVSHDGSEVWVAQLIKTRNTPSIRIFDTRTGKQLQTIELGNKGTTELEFSKDEKRVFASQMATGLVYELDRKTRKVLRTFKTRGTWTKVIKLSADEKTLFASNWVSNDVSVVDLESGKYRRRLRAGKWPRGMYPTPDGKHLYVAIFGEGRLVKFDLRTGKRKLIYDRGTSMRHIVADEARNLLFVSDLGGNRIMTLDLRTDKVKFFVRTNYRPNTIDLSPDKKILFVSTRGRGNPESYLKAGPEWGAIQLFDTKSGKLLDVIVGGNQPTGLDLSGDGKVLVFSDFLDDRLRIYHVPSYETLKAGKGGRAKSYRRDLRK